MTHIPPDQAFGSEIRSILAAKGISIRELARATKYDRAYVSRVLAGKQGASREMVAALDQELEAEGALLALADTLTPDDHDRVTRTIAQPGRLDLGTVHSLADVLAAQRRLDDSVEAAVLIPAATAQMDTTLGLLKSARGQDWEALMPVAAEYVQFVGWLHASAGHHERAMQLLTQAEEMADEVGDGVLGAQASNFKGYVARQRGSAQGIVRHFYGAFVTPAASAPQRMGDAAQASHGYALLGQTDNARRLLDEAAGLSDQAEAETPPGTAYWLTASFQRMNLGLAHLGLGDHGLAEDHLISGLTGLPVEQQSAEWTGEYRQALETARAAG